ncbi:MAG: zinc-dependent alcohol dehydrogenase family protein [Candidatus Pseudomonas phytovorans]|uniref:Zinc-dependent alcohol dehydrogenase family protein n=1 Tax=Candidatus Pseudomonas phytovorans TaxID=3121377 RepID=A0AAJ5WET5_9PSED|nr:zinc-dependent alcohol dehydrogenase family protein [Pseudomonas sp.]WEK29367.1 MAG: zinc-dependent alcohol dehydrogenase family protein [Pseudomonas sp.]
MTDSMRALVLHDFINNQMVESSVPRPQPLAGQVLVRVVASGVNPIDYKIRTGNAPYAMPALPAILGTDLAGTVEAVGDGVDRFTVGDAVYGLAGGVFGMPGSLAEFVAVDAALLALKPRGLSFREAAALPLVMLTAWEGLVDAAHVRQGQRVLIHGGAGGVGHIAVQLAKAFGAEVYASVSAAKSPVVQAYGAIPIDYQLHQPAEYVEKHTGGKGFDVIYDTVGGATLDASFEAVAHRGHIVSCAAFGTHALATGSLRAMTLSGVFVLLPMLTGNGRAHHGKVLEECSRLIDEGKLKPNLHPRRFFLHEAMEAHNLVESGNAQGKVVIEVC